MTPRPLRWCLILLIAALALPGCLRPKRTHEPARSYVLSAVPAERGGGKDPAPIRGLGIAQIQIPSYLLDLRVTIRKGASEVHYSEHHRWAERLDKGIQRVLGANLSSQLGTARVELSAWDRQSIQAELHVSVEQFEYDDSGAVVLEARWRLAAPGGEPTYLLHHSRVTRPAPVAAQDMASVVAELSNAVGDLSREIVGALPAALASAPAAEGGRRP